MEVVQKFNFNVTEGTMVVNNTNITIVGDYETPFFSGKEMCEALGYKNPKDALQKNVKPKHKTTLEELKKLVQSDCTPFLWPFKDLSYHEGKAVYINKQGLESLLVKSKLVGIEHIIDNLTQTLDLNLNIVDKSKEQEFIGAIKITFQHKAHETQFRIGTYRIDLYFTDAKIAVECDELGHRDRDPVYEMEREEYIKHHLGCRFLRFNPDHKEFNIFMTINKLMKMMEMNFTVI
jgi:very-short-patch-repair endonuclease